MGKSINLDELIEILSQIRSKTSSDVTVEIVNGNFSYKINPQNVSLVEDEFGTSVIIETNNAERRML